MDVINREGAPCDGVCIVLIREVVVGGAAGPAMSFEDAVAYVSDLLAQGKRLKDACAEVAAASGHSSRELYNASLS